MPTCLHSNVGNHVAVLGEGQELELEAMVFNDGDVDSSLSHFSRDFQNSMKGVVSFYSHKETLVTSSAENDLPKAIQAHTPYDTGFL